MKNNLSNIKKAIKYLNNNECIGIPTETVYGLAAAKPYTVSVGIPIHSLLFKYFIAFLIFERLFFI